MHGKMAACKALYPKDARVAKCATKACGFWCLKWHRHWFR